jgi:hypothetical protein
MELPEKGTSKCQECQELQQPPVAEELIATATSEKVVNMFLYISPRHLANGANNRLTRAHFSFFFVLIERVEKNENSRFSR